MLRENPGASPPAELIDDPRFTELVDPIVAVERHEFETKYQAGVLLKQLLSPIPPRQLRTDADLWSWLAFWFFDQLCPADGRGYRKPKENAKYIARPGDHRYGLDKHLLFFPWKMCLLHGETCGCFFGDPPGADTRAQREWTGYHLNVSTALVELGSRLYAGEDGASLKRGATGKRKGNLRRFVQVIKQLEVTYAIHGMTVDQIQTLLPKSEFKAWLA